MLLGTTTRYDYSVVAIFGFATILSIILLGAFTPVQAADVSWSTTAPTVDGSDIANTIGSLTDVGNVHGGDPNDNDSSTFLAWYEQGVGQTFTTGAAVGGYALSSFSYQHVAYTSDTSTWTVDSGWGAGSQYEIKLGTISGSTLTPITTQAVFVGDTDFGTTTELDVAGEQSGTGAGEWWTFTFDSPLILNPNTTYAFSSYLTPGAFIELNGTSTDAYAGGGAFSDASGTTTTRTGDRVFHADLAVNTESVWNVDADGNWSDPNNWLNGDPNTGSNPILGNVITGDRTVTLDSSASLNSINFNNPIGDGDYFIVPASSETLTLTGDAEINITGRHWLRAEVAGTTVNTFGDGELILDAVNSFGALNVNDTNAAVTRAGAIPDNADVTIDNNGTLRFWGSNNGFFGGTNGTGLDPNTNESLDGGINIVDAASFIDFNDGANVTLSGVVSGDGAVGAQSGAKLTLSGANTYTGVTNVFDATVTVTGSGTLGSDAAGTNLFGVGVVVLDGVSSDNEQFGIGGASQLQLDSATTGVSAGSALITVDGATDGTQAKISNSGTSTVNSNIHAPNTGFGDYVEISAASGSTLNLSGTLSADETAANARTFVFDSDSGANINITGRITDHRVDSSGAIDPNNVNNSDDVSVIKRGAGTLTISTGVPGGTSEVDFWQDSTVIEEGTLVVESNGAGVGELWSNLLTVQSGATLDVTDWQDDTGSPRYNLQIGQTLGGAGTVDVGTGALGMFDDNSLSPGDSVGTLKVTNNMNITAVGGGGSVNVELGNDKDMNAVDNSENDLISIGGSLTTPSAVNLTFNAIPVEFALESGTTGYRVINHTGGTTNFSGSSAQILNPSNPDPNNPLSTRQSLAITSPVQQVNLVVSGAAANQTWTGNTDPNWAAADGKNNWSGTGTEFFDLDHVTFNASGNNKSINVAQDVVPASVTVTGSGANYNFSGSRISTESVTVSNNAVASFSNTVDGDVSVENTGTLAGTGDLQDDVSVASGGTIQVGEASLPGSIGGGIISLNVESFGTIPNGPSNTAGVVDADYWNDTWRDHSVAGAGLNGFVDTDLQDSSGTATTLDVTFATNDTYNVSGFVDPGVDSDGTHNKRLLNGYLNNGAGGTTSISLDQIPYSDYDLYVYFSSDVANREGSITDGSSTYYFSTVGGPSIAGANAAFSLGTATSPTDPNDGDAGDGDDPLANYVVFSDLGGATQLVTSDILNYGGIAGFQVVADSNAVTLTGETMTVLGDLALASGSTVSFNIASSNVNDHIDIGGAFSVTDGVALEVLLDSSVSASSLAAGDTWDLFDFDPNSAIGSWDPNDFTLPSGLAGGLSWNTSSLLTTGELSVVLLGDFNFDGTVNGLDFLTWQRGESPNPLSASDLTDWQNNYGATALTTLSLSETVPEPSSLVLLLTGVCGLMRRRRATN